MKIITSAGKDGEDRFALKEEAEYSFGNAYGMKTEYYLLSKDEYAELFDKAKQNGIIK